MVGLLLLLGLFWYWASTLIGDDNNKPGSTPTAQVIVSTQPAGSTETTTTQQPGVTATTGTENTQTTQEPTQPANNNGGEATETATSTATEASGDTKFSSGDEVVVNDNEVNMRAEATTDSTAVQVLNQGDTLQITGEPVEGGDYTWWPVEDVTTGNTGYVVEQYLDPAS